MQVEIVLASFSTLSFTKPTEHVLEIIDDTCSSVVKMCNISEGKSLVSIKFIELSPVVGLQYSFLHSVVQEFPVKNIVAAKALKHEGYVEISR